MFLDSVVDWWDSVNFHFSPLGGDWGSTQQKFSSISLFYLHIYIFCVLGVGVIVELISCKLQVNKQVHQH